MGERNQIDLAKSVDELNSVISKEQQAEEDKTVSLLEKALRRVGFKGNDATDLNKSEGENGTAIEPQPSEELEPSTELEPSMELETPPTLEEVENGEVDAQEFIEKSLEYMGGIHEQVKLLTKALVEIKAENADLKKAIGDSNYALGALVSSQTELHKSFKEQGQDVTPAREAVAPSRAHDLNKSEQEIESDLETPVKDSFDDAEINILAKAVREKTITNEEYMEAKKTYTLPKRLLS